VGHHLGELSERRFVAAGQGLSGRQQFFDVAGSRAGRGEVEAVGWRQFQQPQLVPGLVGNPVVQRFVRWQVP
jgi:hypothetical protein